MYSFWIKEGANINPINILENYIFQNVYFIPLELAMEPHILDPAPWDFLNRLLNEI